MHSGLHQQKTPTSQPTLSRALISPFTLGAALIVFRVRKSRRGYERNERREASCPDTGLSPHNGELRTLNLIRKIFCTAENCQLWVVQAKILLV